MENSLISVKIEKIDLRLDKAITIILGSKREMKRLESLTEAEANKTIMLAEANAKAKRISAINDIEISAMQQRAFARVGSQEIQRQESLEAIFSEASTEVHKILESEKSTDYISDVEVSDDWLIKFRNFAQDVCDKDVQKTWTKILAGEILKPGSYSIKALNFLATMSHKTAVLFQKVCNYVFDEGMIIFFGSKCLSEYGLTVNDFATLKEDGLINYDTFGRGFSRLLPLVLENNGVKLSISIDIEARQLSGLIGSEDFSMETCFLTSVGKELRHLTVNQPDINYLNDFIKCYQDNGYAVSIEDGIVSDRVISETPL